MTEELPEAPEPARKKPGRPRKTAVVQETLALGATPVVAPAAAQAEAQESPAKVVRKRKPKAEPEAAPVVVPVPVAVEVPLADAAPAKRRAGRPRKVDTETASVAEVSAPKSATPRVKAPKAIPTPEMVPAAPVASSPVPMPERISPTPAAVPSEPENVSAEASRPREAGPRGKDREQGRGRTDARGRGRGRGRGRQGNRPGPVQAPRVLVVEDGAESRPDLVDDDSGFDAEVAAAAAENNGRSRRRKGRERGGKEQDNGVNWCTRRWLEQLEKYAHGQDVRQRWARGKVYARRGQVVELEVGPNGVLAKVQGSRPKPYQVRMELNKLRREAWGRVLIAVSGKAHYTARLLAGEMPQEIESIFASSGARLFPAGDHDFRCKCSCPDPLVPCKHVSAVYHAMGAALEADPFLLFSMRGKSKNQFLQDLRDMRFRAQKGGKQAEYSQEEVAQMVSFWRMGRLTDAVLGHHSWEGSDPARLLHNLGDPPPSVVRAGMAMPVFESTYRQVSEAVMRLPRDL